MRTVRLNQAVKLHQNQNNELKNPKRLNRALGRHYLFHPNYKWHLSHYIWVIVLTDLCSWDVANINAFSYTCTLLWNVKTFDIEKGLFSLSFFSLWNDKPAK